MPASTITFTDKIEAGEFTFQNANEIKNVVNQHATEIDSKFTADSFTTVGNAVRQLTNPSAISFFRINADNSVTARSASDFKTDLGLNNVDNTSDATKNAATVTLTNKTLTTPVIEEISGSTKAQRPIVAKTSSFTIDADVRNTFVTLAITENMTITLNDAESGVLPTGTEVDFFWLSDAATHTVTFAVADSQTIISKNGDLLLSAVGSGATLKCISANTWALVGDLTT